MTGNETLVVVLAGALLLTLGLARGWQMFREFLDQ